MQPVVEFADHFDGEAAAAGEDFGDAAAGAEYGFQVFAGQALLFHAEEDGVDGVGEVDWKILLLVFFDEGGEDVELVAFRGAFGGTPQNGERLHGVFVVGLGVDGF